MFTVMGQMVGRHTLIKAVEGSTEQVEALDLVISLATYGGYYGSSCDFFKGLKGESEARSDGLWPFMVWSLVV